MKTSRTVYVAMAERLRRLPNFKGKVRFLLAFAKFLGINDGHTFVEATLHRPVPYQIGLDLFCKHELMAYLMDGYEVKTVKLLRKLWHPGDIFLDIGANIGLVGIPFTMECCAELSKNSAPLPPITYCIEAAKANYTSLRKNIILNSLEHQMVLLHYALGDAPRQVEIQLEKDQLVDEGTGTANIIPTNQNWNCRTSTLALTTIDILVEQELLPKSCCLIKIDTDGYDFYILQGATALLTRSRPLIYGEFMAKCLGWHGHSIYDVQNFLKGLDYRLLRRNADWTFSELSPGLPFVMDALCVPNEKMDVVSRRLGEGKVN